MFVSSNGTWWLIVVVGTFVKNCPLLFWFEEPVAPDDYEGMRKLAEKTTIPIATGENEYTRYGFRDLIEHDSAAILNADAKVLGGVTEWMKVAALAQAHDLDVAPHGSQDIHIHLVSAVANGLILSSIGIRWTRCGARCITTRCGQRRWHGQPRGGARPRR